MEPFQQGAGFYFNKFRKLKLKIKNNIFHIGINHCI
jgi:hypothetical protein